MPSTMLIFQRVIITVSLTCDELQIFGLQNLNLREISFLLSFHNLLTSVTAKTGIFPCTTKLPEAFPALSQLVSGPFRQ